MFATGTRVSMALIGNIPMEEGEKKLKARTNG